MDVGAFRRSTAAAGARSAADRGGPALDARRQRPTIGARGPRPRLPGHVGVRPDRLARASATLLRRGGDRLLIDCGEGTQRQLLRSDAGLVDLEHVFLTHLHADHVLGLPGMLKTFALRGRELPITVYGPRGPWHRSWARSGS